MQKNILKALTYCIAVLTLSGCYYNKKLVYLDDKQFSTTKPTLIESKRTAYRLQPSDIISVQVKAPGETTVTSSFNLNAQQAGSMFASPANFFMDGYTIDPDGKITIPVIGEVSVKDMTTEEAQQTIQKAADKYLTKAIVIVKLTSFKVTVLGEVRNPGYYYVFNSQATILEGLGMAGDLTPVGNRENVKLIRQTPGGSEVVMVDLTDTDLLKSPYFFMMPGDVLYVAPLRARSNRSNLELATFLFGALTTTILVMSFVQQNR
ncbi:MAG TPA: polysaccharide biosynthesis/export family protein [Cyclobacteriaceae bacterium]|nr:polysaccharide biosynthesis/export family protein [Cyclobacteriaceae bacterium]